MATSSILGGVPAPSQSKGRGTDSLGPSDSSDSGSDVLGERPLATGTDDPDELGATPADPSSDTDRFGTGERGSATPAARRTPRHPAGPGEPLAGDRGRGRVDRRRDLASGDDPSAGPDPEHEDDPSA